MSQRSLTIAWLLAGPLIAAASGTVCAQAAADYPSRPIRLIVPNAGASDVIARVLKTKPSRDLTGITNLVDILAGLIVNPAFAPATVKQFVDYARSNPGKVNYASAGTGTYPHLDMLRFMRAAGFAAFIRLQIAAMGKIVRDLGLTAD